MGKKETAAVDKLIATSAGKLKLFKIENTVNSAMPDVTGENRRGTHFWLEAKQIPGWPKRESTFPLKGKFERGQEAWSKAWISWKGHSFLYLRVGETRNYEYYLIDFIRESLEEKNRHELMMLVVREGIENIIEYLEKI